jgi:hypothetical protein
MDIGEHFNNTKEIIQAGICSEQTMVKAMLVHLSDEIITIDFLNNLKQ